MKDLTISNIERQNVLNNRFAVSKVQEHLDIEGMLFEGEYRFTKKMVADFYQVDTSTIDRYLQSNSDELKHNGYVLCKGKQLKEFKLEFAHLINEASKTTQLGLFNFRSFLNMGMLLTESEKAKKVRSLILDFVITTINEKTGGGTKYINRRDVHYLPAAITEENYRKNLTSAINQYVDGHPTYKYSQITDFIYKAVFKENAKEYREVLKLDSKDNVRHTLYSEVLLVISSFENGVGAAIIPQRDRADSISINTNTQSAVKARDLRSNSKQVLKLKKAYEAKYSNGFFATKRGEAIPADKDKQYCIELSYLGKNLTAWYMQRPNLSYGESVIFDKYFNTLFKKDYLPEDAYALSFWMRKIMDAWTQENPLGLEEEILTMKAYAPYHLLFAISMVFAKCNNQTNVPSPSECLKVASENNLVDSIINIAANCLNSAISAEKNNCEQNNRSYIPQNWVKSKSSGAGIMSAIQNYFSFLPTMNKEMDSKLKNGVKIDSKYFSYRVQAED